MIGALLLSLATCWGPQGTTAIKAAWVTRECNDFDAAVAKDPVDILVEDRALIHGLVMDTARIGGGAALDLYATAYCMQKGCKETNPLGFNAEARVALKAGLAIGGILACHEMRRHGHPNRAKWVGRALLAMQVGFAVNNVVQARR